MTMSIRIKNEDQSRTAKIAVTDFNANRAWCSRGVRVAPGEDRQSRRSRVAHAAVNVASSSAASTSA